MARATDGATGPVIGKPPVKGDKPPVPGDRPARVPAAERPAARPTRPSVRRAPQWLSAGMQFLNDVRAEMTRVAWPDRQAVIASSLVVVFVLIVTALYLAGWDLVLAEAFKQVLHR